MLLAEVDEFRPYGLVVGLQLVILAAQGLIIDRLFIGRFRFI